MGLKETIERLATANGGRWYGHVPRRNDDSVLTVALDLEVSGKRKRGRSKKTWKKQMEEETEKIGLQKEDALRRDKCRVGVRAMAKPAQWYSGSSVPFVVGGVHFLSRFISKDYKKWYLQPPCLALSIKKR